MAFVPAYYKNRPTQMSPQAASVTKQWLMRNPNLSQGDLRSFADLYGRNGANSSQEQKELAILARMASGQDIVGPWVIEGSGVPMPDFGASMPTKGGFGQSVKPGPTMQDMMKAIGGQVQPAGEMPMADAVEGIFTPNIATTRHPGLPPLWEDSNFGQTPDLSDFNRSGPGYNSPVNVAQMRSEGLSPRTAQGEQSLQLSRDAWAAEKARERMGQYMMNPSTSVMPPGARAPALMAPTVLPPGAGGGDYARYLAKMDLARGFTPSQPWTPPTPSDQEAMAAAHSSVATNNRVGEIQDMMQRDPELAKSMMMLGQDTPRQAVAAKALKDRGLSSTGVSWGPPKPTESNRPQFGPGSAEQPIEAQATAGPQPQGPWDRGPSVFKAGLPEDERRDLVTQNAMMRALNRRARLGGLVNVPIPGGDTGDLMTSMALTGRPDWGAAMARNRQVAAEGLAQRDFLAKQGEEERSNRLAVETVRTGPQTAQAENERTSRIVGLADVFYKQAMAGITKPTRANMLQAWQGAMESATQALGGALTSPTSPAPEPQGAGGRLFDPAKLRSSSSPGAPSAPPSNRIPVLKDKPTTSDIISFIRTNFPGAGGDPEIRRQALDALRDNGIDESALRVALNELDPTRWSALSLPFRNLAGLFNPPKSPLYYPELRSKYSGFSTGEEDPNETAKRHANIGLLKILSGEGL
jgi:hypothetical protein